MASCVSQLDTYGTPYLVVKTPFWVWRTFISFLLSRFYYFYDIYSNPVEVFIRAVLVRHSLCFLYHWLFLITFLFSDLHIIWFLVVWGEWSRERVLWMVVLIAACWGMCTLWNSCSHDRTSAHEGPGGHCVRLGCALGFNVCLVGTLFFSSHMILVLRRVSH